MYTGGEAAEQVVRMSLNGVEVAAKITGEGAKQLAVLLYTILKDQKKTKGAARLSSMLRSGKELKVFTVKQSDLKTFSKEAKRYGVLYCALKGIKKNPDGLVDIMVRAEDASKINRIVERFELATVDKASIKNEILKDREKKAISKPVKEQKVEGLTPEENEQAEAFLDELLGTGESQTVGKAKEPEKPGQERKPRKKEPTRQGEQRGQTNARLSEPISEKQRKFDRTSTDRNGERRSVKADLEKIRQEREKVEKKQMPKEPERKSKDRQKPVLHQQPERKKRRKEKER